MVATDSRAPTMTGAVTGRDLTEEAIEPRERSGEILANAARGYGAGIEEMLGGNPALANTRDGEGRTPLWVAVQHGRLAVVELLLAYGADIDARNDWGETALHWAARRGALAAIKLLTERGASVGARDLWGKTPLERALEAGRYEAASLLHAPINRRRFQPFRRSVTRYGKALQWSRLLALPTRPAMR